MTTITAHKSVLGVLPIDYALPFANLNGRPLFTIDPPLSNHAAEAIIKLHERGRATSSLINYTQAADILAPGQRPSIHHKVICDAIDGLLADEYDDLIINTPPGSAKSTYTSHALGAYFLGRRPRDNIILAMHTADIAERFSGKVRDTYASEAHQQLFPDATLSSSTSARARWATTLGGEFLATGAGASILGFRADLALIDDPVGGFEQAQSETQLAKLHNWFETDLMTRLKPGGKIVLICQRLSPNDLAGYMIARHAENPSRRLKIVTLRMEYEEGDEDGTGRSPGDRLWPEWFTQEMVEDRRRDEYRWQTLYQQRPPSAMGDWVSADCVAIVERQDVPEIDMLSRYVCVDLALSINKGDYTVFATVGVDSATNITVLDAWRTRAAVDNTADKLLDLVEHHKPVECLIDDDNAAKVYLQLLADRGRARSIVPPMKMLPMRGQDKETRAAPLRALFRSKRIRFVKAPWNEWLLREVVMFPNATGAGVDDGVDALGLIGRRLSRLSRPAGAAVPSPPAPTWSDMNLDGLYDERLRTQSLGRRRF